MKMKMKTLAIPSVTGLSLSTRTVAFLRTPKFVRLALKSPTQTPIFTLSSNPHVDLINTADNDTQEIYEPKSVGVKFQIHKACSFGDELILVGDDPMFGLWDPENGIQLTWSEGHVWAVEMDVPVSKKIQFKFVLKESGGSMMWQPGPDRTFETWETNNTITVCEEWEDGEQQKIIEDDKEDPKEEVVPPISSNSADKQISKTAEEPEEVKPIANNIGNPNKDSLVNEEMSLTCEGGPVLVPGLETEEAVGIEGEKSSSIGAELTASSLEDKQEMTETLSDEEECDASLEQQFVLAREEEQQVIVNDIQWGRTTIHKLLPDLASPCGSDFFYMLLDIL